MIKIKKASDCSESDITPEPIYQKRREFMKAGSVIGTGLLLNSLPAVSMASMAIGEYKKKVVSLNEELTDFEDATRYNNFITVT